MTIRATQTVRAGLLAVVLAIILLSGCTRCVEGHTIIAATRAPGFVTADGIWFSHDPRPAPRFTCDRWERWP